MPLRGHASDLIRLVVGKRGRVQMRTELVIRFDYGSVVPWVTRVDEETMRAIAGPDMVVLRTTVPLRGEDMRTVGEFTVAEGETAEFALTYQLSHYPVPKPVRPAGRAARHGEVLARVGRPLHRVRPLVGAPSCAR